jgi:hypothetical protein
MDAHPRPLLAKAMMPNKKAKVQLVIMSRRT